MELIELTAENIETYLDDCVAVQQYLVKPDQPIDAAQITATATATHNYFVGLVEEGHVVGLGVVNKIVHPVRTNAYIDNIVVHQDFQGRGLFTSIMNALEDKAREWGAEQTKLTCSREAVQPIYEKRGYVEKTTTKYYVKQL